MTHVVHALREPVASCCRSFLISGAAFFLPPPWRLLIAASPSAPSKPRSFNPFFGRGVSIGVRACAAQAQGLLVRSSSWPLLASCRWPSCHAGQFRRFVASRWGSWHSFVVALGVFRP